MSEEPHCPAKEKAKRPGPLSWLFASGDELTVGPRVPARVRVAWGVLVLLALAWLIILEHKAISDANSMRSLIIETRSD